MYCVSLLLALDLKVHICSSNKRWFEDDLYGFRCGNCYLVIIGPISYLSITAFMV